MNEHLIIIITALLYVNCSRNIKQLCCKVNLRGGMWVEVGHAASLWPQTASESSQEKKNQYIEMFLYNVNPSEP